MITDGGIEYSFFMDGPDDSWTCWAGRNYKEYTNLAQRKIHLSCTGTESTGVEDTGEGSFTVQGQGPMVLFYRLLWIIYPLCACCL